MLVYHTGYILIQHGHKYRITEMQSASRLDQARDSFWMAT